MKTIKIAAALLLGTMLATQINAQTDAKEQLVVPLSEPGKPFKLNVGINNGSIKVVTYEGKDVIIDAQTGSEKRNKSGVNVSVNVNTKNSSSDGMASNGMKKINAGRELDITAEEKNNRITVHSNSWKSPITLTIKVPQSEANLKLSTINDGDITVTNVSGELEINNTNGGVYLTNISGSVVASALNSSVVVTFKSIDPKAAMAFSTLNGNIDVTFPTSLKANVKLKSDRGEMFTDFDIEADKAQPKVERSSQSGMYRVNIENWVYGKINTGGPELMMKTMNGNIYIRKAK
ncbi:MAG: DUF4097 family beta strand repeat-containing protein [Bacteroidota bacterium]